MDYILAIAAILGIVAGGFLVARSPSFWFGFISILIKKAWPFIVDFIMNNRPKTDKEWDEWRKLSSMNQNDMSPSQRARYRELKKLNAEYREKN